MLLSKWMKKVALFPHGCVNVYDILHSLLIDAECPKTRSGGSQGWWVKGVLQREEGMAELRVHVTLREL